MKLIKLSMLINLICLLGCQNFTSSQEDLEKLKSTKKCPECNLRNTNLYKLDLSSAYLSKANLTSSNLSDAVLWNANLKGAILIDADMSAEEIALKSLIIY